jgi:hypothetical protein
MSYAFETARILRMEAHGTPVAPSGTADIEILEGCTLVRLGALLTVTADAESVTTVTQRILPGSAVGVIACDTITVPDTTAVGKIVYVDVTPQALHAGDELHFAVAAGGTNTRLEFFAVVVPNEESVGNEADMIASA